MPFCSQCGSKLDPGSKFCDQCGAQIEMDEPVEKDTASAGEQGALVGSVLDTFVGGGWQNAWTKAAKGAAGGELGVILTDVPALAAQLHCSVSQIMDLIEDYSRSASVRGVYYYLLDLAQNGVSMADGSDVQSVVDLMTNVCGVARPKYLFILGNEEIVNVATWENQVGGDPDSDVLADLPYATLDTVSPWEGQKYNFSQVLRVGRVPSFGGESFGDFKAYFDNAKKGIGNIGKIVPFGLSALVWEGASNAQYGAISSRNVNLSPDVSLSNVESKIPHDVNLLYFNLHGSDSAEFWYGQEGGSYPQAFSPEVVRGIGHPFFLGVEACYGARYTDGLTDNDSIVLAAMQSGCLALLGSSRIAFGPCDAPGSDADIMIGTYVKGISNGDSAGDAYCDALKELMSESEPDDSTIKTLAEFSLYGDPSARTGKNKCKSLLGKAFGGVAKGLHVPMPDVRRALKAKMVDMSSKAAITSKVLSRTFNRFDYMKDVDPEYFQVGSKGLYQASFTKRVGSFDHILKVYFDDGGKVKKELISK